MDEISALIEKYNFDKQFPKLVNKIRNKTVVVYGTGLLFRKLTETYDFSDSKVESLEHEVLIQGNADYLTERNTECELLQREAADITSVQIDCDLSSNQMIETQYFNLSTLDLSLLDIGFTEAGGVYPNGMSGENYKDVQRSLEMSGYDCELK